MGEVIANTLNKDKTDIFTFNRTNKEKKRVDGEIGFSCIRAGKIIGDHTVLFASDSEILKIEHSALNRSTFASRAIKAAEFIYDMSPGFYNMYDVIDFQIKNMNKGFLVLENGSVFEGLKFGVNQDARGEIVFNTSMTGYQEIITDPSYYQQMLHSHILILGMLVLILMILNLQMFG